MGVSHGMNDAQKTMGIIALALVTGTNSAARLTSFPAGCRFCARHRRRRISRWKSSAWIKVLCALTMCAGTAVGGWRIIKTLGHKMVRLHPVHGFAAETTAATILATAAHFGMPVSTTHAVTTSIMGVGCAKGLNHLKLDVVERIIWAWILTLPAAGGMAYLLVMLARALGWLGA
jgi:PiT family inorganic phosphate transporter